MAARRERSTRSAPHSANSGPVVTTPSRYAASAAADTRAPVETPRSNQTRASTRPRTPRQPARLRSIARRVLQLTAEERELAREIETITRRLAPQLRQPGIGPHAAAQLVLSWSHQGRITFEAAFARLAGAAPIPASSGQTIRYRLDRSGDRNPTEHCTRSSSPGNADTHRTIAYIERRIQEGKTRREATRCLKRYLARSLYRLLERRPPLAT